MLPLETLVGPNPTTPIVDEMIRRLCNPAEAIVDDEQLTRYIIGVYGVGELALEGAQIDADLVTPTQFNRLVVPSLIRAGFDSAIIAINPDSNSIYTLNRDKQPNICMIKHLPPGTIEQINASHEMVSRLSDEIVDAVPKDLKQIDQWVHAAYVMAQKAYGEKKRATGRPYISHPEDIAAIVNAGLDAIRKMGHKVSDQTRALLICAALLHDALEEWVKPDNYYQLATGKNPHAPEVLTPLVIKTTMEKLGMQGSKASYLANAMRLVTHEKGKNGESWMLSFAQYLYRGSGNRLVVPIKLTDMFHNLTIEPKPMPKQKPGQTLDEYIDKLVYWDRHRGEYHHYVYENGYKDIDYPKNALKIDVSLRYWGPAYYEWLANQAYPDNPPDCLDREFDEHDSVLPGSVFANKVIPEMRRSLVDRTGLPLVA